MKSVVRGFPILRFWPFRSHPSVAPSPMLISLAMTARCNLRCVMCDHAISKIEKKDFDPALIDQIDDFIAKAEIVDLTGLGEPLLSSLFWDILDRFPAAAGEKPFLMFNTNGTLLNGANIARMLRSRVK